MIEVKGTKEGPQEPDPSARYTLKEDDRKSKKPLLFGLFLTGLAVYLKSIFPSGAQTEGDGALPKADNKGSPEASDEMAMGDAVDEETITNSVAKDDKAIGSGSPLVNLLPAPMEFPVIGPANIGEFLPPEPPLAWDDSFPALSVPPANDNSGGEGGIVRPPSGPEPQTPTGPGGEKPGNPPPGKNEPPCGEEQPCSGGGGGEGPCDEDDGEEPQGNRAPRVAGPVYLTDIAGCVVLVIGLAELLQGAEDPDADPLSVSNLIVSSGQLTYSGDVWRFQSDPQFSGPVTITYQISDGQLSVTQYAHFSVLSRPLIEGTDGDDNILGTMCSDDIDGGDGNDNIDGRAGDDVISGGAGNDHIVAGDGNDVVFGGIGNDIIFGGAGSDQLYGGGGDDRIFGEDGDDIIFGEGGDDFLSGGDGDDWISGGDGDDIIVGDAGDDILFGDAGDDTVHGGAGNDVIDGGDGDDLLDGGDGDDLIMDGAGSDTVRGGAGNDHVVAAMDGADDIYDGEEGCDTLDYSAASQSLLIDLVEGKAAGVEIGEDCISGFETIIGGEGADHFIVGDQASVLVGNGGENTFEFLPPEAPLPSSPIMHEILDFKAGDRIRISKYDVFEKVFDKLEDDFEKIYGDDIDDDDIPIRYRYDNTEYKDRTIIEADLNNDDIFETTITLQGSYVLVVVEHA